LRTGFGRVRILQLTVLWFRGIHVLDGFHALLRSAAVYPRHGRDLVSAVNGRSVPCWWPDHRARIASRRGRGAKQLVSGLGRGARGLLGGHYPAAAGTRLAVLFWVGILPGLLIIYIRPQRCRSRDYLETRARRQQAHAQRPSRRRGARRLRGGEFPGYFQAARCWAHRIGHLAGHGMLGAYYSVTTWVADVSGNRAASFGDGANRLFDDVDLGVICGISGQRLAVGCIRTAPQLHPFACCGAM